MLEYHYWEKEQKKTYLKKSCAIYTDDTKELHEIYDRKLDIYEDILNDLAPQLDDEQYCGTTSWDYEDELKSLGAIQEKLEELVDEKYEAARIAEDEKYKNLIPQKPKKKK